ncbi:hypothetical protein AVEN_186065-1 [Araneus ventricosus]|uniref:Uncharacterized protein n=1 Tax=Araneus ventricosus TaxID=182803 RepID=A0A4Y2K031_ARAVE|nr:hypothetical protein AVEN_186065-1 [Araneus ventricosus]
MSRGYHTLILEDLMNKFMFLGKSLGRFFVSEQIVQKNWRIFTHRSRKSTRRAISETANSSIDNLKSDEKAVAFPTLQYTQGGTERVVRLAPPRTKHEGTSQK